MQTVILTNDEAHAFLLWREHQDLFKIMLSAGAFGVKNGVVELNFDSHGVLTRIDVNRMLFRRSE